MPSTERKSHMTRDISCILGGLSLVACGFFAGLQFRGGGTVPPPPPPVEGSYEWQWAGENWFGRITLSEHNSITQARVGVLKKVYAPDGSASFEVQDEVMQLVEGTYEQKGDSKVAINMLVRKKVKGDHPNLQQTVAGVLDRCHCFVGKVEYHDHLTGNKHFGDMILVNHSSSLGEEIEAWYADTK